MEGSTKFPPTVLLKALGDPVRLKIIETLARPDAVCCSIADRVCACDLERLLGLSQPSISYHMKMLCDAGLAQPRKVGKFVYYRLDRTQFSRLAAWLSEIAGKPAEGRDSESTQDAA